MLAFVFTAAFPKALPMFNSEQKKANKVARAIAEYRFSAATEMLNAGVPANGIERRRREKPTSLMLAVKAKSIELVQLLLEKGADVHARDGDGDTAFHYLDPKEEAKNPTIVRLLMAAGGDINKTNNRGYSALHMMLDRYERAGAVTALLRNGASTEFGYSYYGPVLVFASRRNEPEVIRELVRHGIGLEAVGRNGYTALHMAAAEGNGDVVKTLVELGADIHARDEKMNTPADLAEEKKHIGLANFLRQQMGSGAVTENGWRKVSDDEIAFVSDKKAVSYRLTEIFNFATQEATLLARNLETGSESVTIRNFNLCADDVLRTAAQQLQQQGGNVRALPGIKPVRLIEKR